MIHIYVPLLPRDIEVRRLIPPMKAAELLTRHAVMGKGTNLRPMGVDSLNEKAQEVGIAVLARSSWYACSRGKIAPSMVHATTVVLLNMGKPDVQFDLLFRDCVRRNRPDRVLVLCQDEMAHRHKLALRSFILAEHNLGTEFKEIS